MENINKKNLSNLSGVSVDDIESVFNHIAIAISKGDTVSVPMFGKFTSVLQKGRSGTVPGTNKTYSTSDKMVPKFKSALQLRNLLAGS